MPVKLNGIALDSSTDIKCNGVSLYNLKLNGITVWEKIPAGTVILNKNTAGTVNVTIPVTGSYRIQAIGGGSNGKEGAIGSLVAKMKGLSGGYINVIQQINAGSYSVTVGNYGTSGGNTTFNSLVAGGGPMPNLQSQSGPVNNVSAATSVTSNVTTIQQASNYDGSSTGPGAGSNTSGGGNGKPGMIIITKV